MDWYLDRGVRTAVTELRREIKAQLVRHADASPDELADAELIAGELLTNAVDGTVNLVACLWLRGSPGCSR